MEGGNLCAMLWNIIPSKDERVNKHLNPGDIIIVQKQLLSISTHAQERYWVVPL